MLYPARSRRVHVPLARRPPAPRGARRRRAPASAAMKFGCPDAWRLVEAVQGAYRLRHLSRPSLGPGAPATLGGGRCGDATAAGWCACDPSGRLIPLVVLAVLAVAVLSSSSSATVRRTSAVEAMSRLPRRAPASSARRPACLPSEPPTWLVLGIVGFLLGLALILLPPVIDHWKSSCRRRSADRALRFSRSLAGRAISRPGLGQAARSPRRPRTCGGALSWRW